MKSVLGNHTVATMCNKLTAVNKILRTHAFTFLVITLFIPTLSLASEYPQKISFQDIMGNEDIALGEVEGIVQDHEGFIWLGGRNDLLRFDGQNYLSFPVLDKENNTQASQIRHVQAIMEDSKHTLWVASHLGLFRYDRSNEYFSNVTLPQEIPNSEHPETLNALAETPTGHLLIASANGLYILDTINSSITAMRTNEPKKNNLPSKTVSDVFVDKSGSIWLGMHEGLVRLDRNLESYTLIVPDPSQPKSLRHNSVQTIAEDHHGSIWFGTNYGVFRLNPATHKHTRYLHDPNDPLSLANDITRQIFVDHQGWVWTGSDQGGISLYNEAKDDFIRFQHQGGKKSSLTSNAIRRIYEDSNHDLWIGTYPSGVNFYDRSSAAIIHLAKEPSLNKGLIKNNVEALEADNNGNLWIGAGGITRYHLVEKTFFHYQKTDDDNSGSPSTSVLNGHIDSHGEIRFGSWGQGMLQYDAHKDRFITVPADSSQVKNGITESALLNDNMVWSVYEDSQQSLWISTHFNGLTRFDRKTGLYQFFPPDDQNENAISNSVAWGAFEDSKGRFWVGTSRGLNLMDREQGTFKAYFPDANTPNSLANSSILSIFEDYKHRLWFGTDAGLHLFRPESDDFELFNISNGFLDETIRAITEDRQGNLWLGTNNGITLFNADTLKVRNFSRNNGKIIGGVATGAGISLPDGNVAFGTRSGVYILNAGKLATPSKAPPVVFTEFSVFTKKVGINDHHKLLSRALNHTDSLTLNHTHSMVSIGYSALSYRDPEKNEYAYKLEGFDRDWRQAVNQRRAIYTNLPPGSYTFHVKASNNDGVWNHEGRQLSIHVLPPPWLSWWAYLIYATLIMILLVLFVRQQHNRVHRQQKINMLLEAKVEERTGELQQKHQELETAYSQLETVSACDPLTGLFNRRYLQNLVPLDAAKVQRIYAKDIHPSAKAELDLTFFILDIDFFKPVNDVYGHSAGDQLLIQISQCLKNTCRESDCLARWGGEEFLVVSRYAKRNEALAMAERLRRSIEGHKFKLPDGSEMSKTCSIGFASYPFIRENLTALSWEQVVDIADKALYAAKKSGRNRSVGLSATATTPSNILDTLNSDIKGAILHGNITIIGHQKSPLEWD